MMSTAVRTIIVVALVATACAQGGSGSGEPSDANGSGGNDARMTDAPFTPAADAPIQPLDAAIDGSMTLPDGPLPDGVPPGSNFLCDNNSQCTNAGECCFDFLGASEQGFCIMGTAIFGTCFPPVE